MTTATKPNIFNFATSELSQDAMIAWLVSWASPEYADIEPALHNCGRELISAFYTKRGMSLPSTINTLKVEVQTYRIDVLVTINGNEFIIIEDKTKTKERGTQLTDYINVVMKKRGAAKESIIPIYFKIFEQSCYEKVKSANYEIFDRNDFLPILERGRMSGVSSEIFNNYLEYLCGIESRIKSYKSMKEEAWTNKKLWRGKGQDWRDPWIGLFSNLKEMMLTEWGPKGLTVNWGYVPNQQGGFMGLWFGGRDISSTPEEARAYIQLEKDTIRFKIRINDKNSRKKYRESWHRTLKKNESSRVPLSRPARFGSGKTMTVMEAGPWLVTKNGMVDMHETIQKLAEILQFHSGLTVEP